MTVKHLLIVLPFFLHISATEVAADNPTEAKPAARDWRAEWKAVEEKAIDTKSPVLIWLDHQSQYLRQTLREFYHFRAEHPSHFGGGKGVMIAVPRKHTDGKWYL